MIVVQLVAVIEVKMVAVASLIKAILLVGNGSVVVVVEGD